MKLYKLLFFLSQSQSHRKHYTFPTSFMQLFLLCSCCLLQLQDSSATNSIPRGKNNVKLSMKRAWKRYDDFKNNFNDHIFFFVDFFSSYLGGKQSQKATPPDHSRGCPHQHQHLVPYKDLMRSVTLPNCLTPLWTVVCLQTLWESITLLHVRTTRVTIMRMWHVHRGRVAL